LFDVTIGLPSIIGKMVQLIGVVEQEAKNLMKAIKKYKNQKNQDDLDEEEKFDNIEIGHCKVTNSLKKIGNLESEIKQICSRISNLNQRVNMDSEE
jgi:seryl-tRNA synthetase